MKYILDIPAIVYRDICGIRDYIATDNPVVAKALAESLFFAIKKLTDNPFSYIELNKKFDIETDLRGCFTQSPYIILFKIEANLIKVYRVIDGRSDYLIRLGLTDE